MHSIQEFGFRALAVLPVQRGAQEWEQMCGQSVITSVARAADMRYIVPDIDDQTYAFLAENSADIICRCEMDTTMRYVSPAPRRILGLHPEEMLGKRIADFICPEDLPELIAAVTYANSPNVRLASATLRLRNQNGTYCWLEISATIVRESNTGEPLGAAVTMRDVTERKLVQQQLENLALTDGLTGLSNRRAFDESLAREWKRTLREGSQMSLLMLDVDRFKSFNDQYGHQFGDDCLRAVGSAVSQVICRETDTVARYGGEEFAVILPRTEGAAALSLAETIRQAVVRLRIPHPANVDGDGFASVSIGVATALARQGGSISMPEGIVMSADMALYKAKNSGRNRVEATHLMASPSLQ